PTESEAALTLARGALQTITVTKLAAAMLLTLVLGVVGVAVALGPASGPVAEPEKPPVSKPEPIPPEQKQPDRPAEPVLQLTLVSVRPAYRPGEPVDLTLTIQNNGKEPFSYPTPKLWDLHGFQITRPDGKDVTPIPNAVEIGRAYFLVTVEPGQAVTIKAEQGLQGIN